MRARSVKEGDAGFIEGKRLINTELELSTRLTILCTAKVQQLSCLADFHGLVFYLHIRSTSQQNLDRIVKCRPWRLLVSPAAQRNLNG
jgi:hypothetical protein